LSIQELATDCKVSVEQVLHLCDKLGIAYKSPATRLPLEDAKAIILSFTVSPHNSLDKQPENLDDRNTLD